MGQCCSKQERGHCKRHAGSSFELSVISRSRNGSNASTSRRSPTVSTKLIEENLGPGRNFVEDGRTSNPSTATQAGEDFCFSDTSNFTLNESSQVLSRPIGQGNDPTVRPAQQFGKSRALLLNNITCTGCDVRYGADRDSANLKNILEQLNFEVESHMDKRKEEMFHILREFTDSRKNEHAPMVLVFIGSHGHRDSANRDWFIDTKGEKISEEEVVNYFTPSNAPLIKKTTPKLFFFQFCRQIDREATQSDSIMGLEEPCTFEWLKKTTRSDTCIDTDRELVTSDPAQKYANMLFAFASAPGAAAIRNSNNGSWFVTALCKILIEHSLTEDLLSMLTMVNAAVMRRRGTVGNREVVQMCEFRSHLTEKVFMVPKENAAIKQHQKEHMKSLPDSVELYDKDLKPNKLPDVHPQMHEYDAYRRGPVVKEKFIPSTKQKFGSTFHQQPVSFKTILNITSRKKFITLVGPPGSGKTTLSKKLAKSQPNQSVMFLLRFMDLNYKQPLTCKQLFVDFLCPGFDEKAGENAFRWMIEHQDKCVFVLDGYDQAVWSLENMKSLNASYDTPLPIDQLVANLCCKKFFKDSLLLFTSRPHKILKIPSELRPDATIHVDDLSTEDMEKLFRALAGDKADELWEMVSNKTPQLFGLCHNPLLLQFIIFAFLHGGISKVETVTEVFQTVLDHLRYSDYARNEDIAKLWKPLGKMAYDGMQEETVVFETESLGDLEAADVQDIIIVFARSLGFPGRRLFDGDQLFYFSHQTLQEMFAAKYICEYMSDEKFNEIIPVVAKGGHWSMVRRFLCGLMLGDKKCTQTTSCKTADQLSTKRQAFRKELIEYMKTDVRKYELIDLLTDLQECSDDEKDLLASKLPVKFDFANTPISSSAAHALAEILPRLNQTVEELNLHNCHLNSDTLRVICGGISKMKHGMEKLNLGWNEFGDSRIKIVSGCLRKLGLRRLGLVDCGISAAGLKVLCGEIKLLDIPMEELDLDGNKFGNPAVEIISASGCLRKVKKKLHLRLCDISDDGQQILYGELERLELPRSTVYFGKLPG